MVVYGYAPALGLWLLKLYGHPDVRILDCARDTWRAEGHPWSSAASQPRRHPYRLAERGLSHPGRPGRRCEARSAARVTPSLTSASQAEYRGERFWPSGGSEPGGRAGHIPSAVHQPIDGVYDQRGSFRDSIDLRERLSPSAHLTTAN